MYYEMLQNMVGSGMIKYARRSKNYRKKQLRAERHAANIAGRIKNKQMRESGRAASEAASKLNSILSALFGKPNNLLLGDGTAAVGNTGKNLLSDGITAVGNIGKNLFNTGSTAAGRVGQAGVNVANLVKGVVTKNPKLAIAAALLGSSGIGGGIAAYNSFADDDDSE